MTRDQALALKHGDLVHYSPACTFTVGPRGGVHEHVEQWRVSGAVQTWKRRPERIRVPVKFGMYSNSAIDEGNMEQFHIADECPNLAKRDKMLAHGGVAVFVENSLGIGLMPMEEKGEQ